MRATIRRISLTLSLVVLPFCAQGASPTLKTEQLTCGVWNFSDGENAYYVHFPTMTAVSSQGAPIDQSKKDRAIAGLINALVTGTGPDGKPPTCVLYGVESTVAAEQIRTYLEKELQVVVMKSVQEQMAAFLSDLKKANDADRKQLIDKLSEELAKNPDLVTALKNAMAGKKKP